MPSLCVQVVQVKRELVQSQLLISALIEYAVVCYRDSALRNSQRRQSELRLAQRRKSCVASGLSIDDGPFDAELPPPPEQQWLDWATGERAALPEDESNLPCTCELVSPLMRSTKFWFSGRHWQCRFGQSWFGAFQWARHFLLPFVANRGIRSRRASAETEHQEWCAETCQIPNGQNITIVKIISKLTI